MIALYAVASTVKSAFIIGGWIGLDANANGIFSCSSFQTVAGGNEIYDDRVIVCV